MSADTERPILQRVLAQPELLRDDDLGIALLKECYSLSDAACLTPLLTHNDDKIAEKATWIVRELTPRTSTPRPVILNLLHHSSEGVRYYAVAILHSTLPTLSIDDLAQILQAIAIDESSWVREKGLKVLISYRTPKNQRPQVLQEFTTRLLASPMEYLAAHLQGRGIVPDSLRACGDLMPEAETLRLKVELLFQGLDRWQQIDNGLDPAFNDVRNVLHAHMASAKRRTEVRDHIAALQNAVKAGDKEEAAMARQWLRTNTAGDGVNTFVKTLRLYE